MLCEINISIIITTTTIIITQLAPFQCIAANSLQSGLFSASSAASSTFRLWDKRLFSSPWPAMTNEV